MTGVILTAALFLTALTFACIWVATDTDEYNEQGRDDDA